MFNHNLYEQKQSPQACNFIKKRLWHRCFPVNFAKFPRTPFFTEHLRWLLLYEIDYGFKDYDL